MSLRERYGTRDLTYSNWHRPDSLQRFMPWGVASRLSMIDLDGVEYCSRCRSALALVEAARDVGQPFKATTVMRALAARAGIPALVVLWTPVEGDVAEFRVKRVHPTLDAEWTGMTPKRFAAVLLGLRERHACAPANASLGRAA